MNTIIVNNPAVESFLAKFRNMETGTYECNVCVETMSFFWLEKFRNIFQLRREK